MDLCEMIIYNMNHKHVVQIHGACAAGHRGYLAVCRGQSCPGTHVWVYLASMSGSLKLFGIKTAL